MLVVIETNTDTTQYLSDNFCLLVAWASAKKVCDCMQESFQWYATNFSMLINLHKLLDNF